MFVTSRHLQLLHGLAGFLELEEAYGLVPAFNAKRPLGNSMAPVIARDIAEAVEEAWEDDDYTDEDRIQALFRLLHECTPVLRAILKSEQLSQFEGMEVVDNGMQPWREISGLGDQLEGRPAVSRWWVSWVHHPEYGNFTLYSPWWSTSASSVCAAVLAPTAEAAREVILAAYATRPLELGFRFVECRPDDWSPWKTEDSRFQPEPWMQWPS